MTTETIPAPTTETAPPAPELETPSAGSVVPAPAQTEAPEVAAPVLPPGDAAPTTPEPTSELDRILNGIPEDQRATVIDAFLSKLPVEQRRELGSVNEILRDVDAQAETRGRTEAQRQINQVDYQKAVEGAWQDLNEAATPENRQKYEEVLEGRFNQQTAQQVTGTIWETVSKLTGIKAPQLSEPMVKALKGARTLSEYVAAAMAVQDAISYNQGLEKVTVDTAKSTKAEDTLKEQKLYETVLERLVKGGRAEAKTNDKGVTTYTVLDGNPPVMSGLTTGGTGGYTTKEQARALHTSRQITSQEMRRINMDPHIPER